MASTTLNDLHDGFCKRSPTPDDFRDPTIRKILCAKWVTYHDSLRIFLQKNNLSSEQKYKAYAAFDTLYINAYQHYIKQKCPYFQKKSILINSSLFLCNYFMLSSISSNLDGFLTFLSLLCGLFLLLTLFVHAFYKKTPTLEQKSALRIILVLALLWFPLRWYSEWYINFGNIGDDSRHFSNKCPEVLLAAAFLFLLIMLTFGFSKRKSEVVLHSNPLVFALAVCQFFLIVILRWLYGIFDNLAVAVNNEDSSVLYLVYLMFIIFIISLGAYIIRDTKEGIRNYAKKVILFVTSSPKRYDLEALDFGEEFRAIVSGVATGKAKDYFEVKIAPSITKGEFKDYLEREQPTILHIAMHASLGDGLFFQNEKGDAEPMTTDEFVDILKHVSINEKIETIIFSACNSLPFAEKSKSFCSNAVGMKMPIPDRATAVYALYFYKNLINNITENISLCHNEGKWGLKNHNPPFKPVITPFATAPVDEIPSLI